VAAACHRVVQSRLSPTTRPALRLRLRRPAARGRGGAALSTIGRVRAAVESGRRRSHCLRLPSGLRRPAARGRVVAGPLRVRIRSAGERVSGPALPTVPCSLAAAAQRASRSGFRLRRAASRWGHGSRWMSPSKLEWVQPWRAPKWRRLERCSGLPFWELNPPNGPVRTHTVRGVTGKAGDRLHCVYC
jgi:hypothetical protein